MTIAFYAPMKPPTHPTPSGDRRMARLLMQALEHAGYDVTLASNLRTYDGTGDGALQAQLISDAESEVSRLIAGDKHDLWFTYHCYYKAPDLIGPQVARHFGIPYVIAEASRAKKRLDGPWSIFAEKAEAAIDAGRILFAMSPTDRMALDRDKTPTQRVLDLPPFLDPGPAPDTERGTVLPVNLLTVAMMRPGAKMESYRRLAAALPHLGVEWCLTIVGDGPERSALEAVFAPFGRNVTFSGEVNNPGELRRMYEAASVFVWPGVDEAYGMVYLEAQAAGLPVIAEDHPGPHSVVAGPECLAPLNDPQALARSIGALAQSPQSRQAARAHVLQHHSLEQAAKTLRQTLGGLA